MGRLPEIRNILREDLKEAPSWIEKLINPLNSFMSIVYETLNKNITFKDNITSTIKELSFKTLSTYESASSWETLKFSSGLKNRAIGCMILQIYEDSNTYIPITNAVHVDWLDLNGIITIQFISGLTDSTDYIVRFLII
jgi:hypothetical protein